MSGLTITGNTAGTTTITGSDVADVLKAAVGGGTITGGAGADTIMLGAGADTVVVGTVTAAGIDTIANFATADTIKTNANATANVAGLHDKGDISGTLDVALATFGSGQTNATEEHHAYTFTNNGDTYLLIDNGTAGYDATTDSVIKLTGVDITTLTPDQILNATA